MALLGKCSPYTPLNHVNKKKDPGNYTLWMLAWSDYIIVTGNL